MKTADERLARVNHLVDNLQDPLGEAKALVQAISMMGIGLQDLMDQKSGHALIAVADAALANLEGIEGIFREAFAVGRGRPWPEGDEDDAEAA